MDTETSARERRPFRLGPWRVDPDLCELSDGERKRHVEPRTMSVLAHLAARHGVTVPREELLDAVWKTRFVVEEALTRCISQLRQSLDDDPRNPRFVQTVPKLGYRLLVTPEPITPELIPQAPKSDPPTEPATAVTPPPRSWLRSPLGRGMSAAVLVAVLAGAWWVTSLIRSNASLTQSPPQDELSLWPAPPQSVAILPFVSMSSDPRDVVFADGMTEEVIQLLSRVPRFRVPSRTSSFYFRDRNVELDAIGRQLGVAHVLEGSIRRDRDRLRITVQLIDVRSDAHIWSEVYDRQLADIFDVQEAIATAIAQKLADSLRPELAIGHPSATKDLVAYQLYLEARAKSRSLTEPNIRAGIDLYKSALERDPQFAAAWAALALAYWVLPGFADVDAKEVGELDALAKTAAEKALAFDASLGDACMVLADYEHTRRRTSAAEGHYRRALAAVPGNPSVHIGYAAMLSETGRLAEAMKHREIGWKLEPLGSTTAFHMARGYLALGRDADARPFVALSHKHGLESPALDHLEAHLAVRARDFAAARELWARKGDPEEVRAMSSVYDALENPRLRPAALAEIGGLQPWFALPFRGRVFAACVLGDGEAAYAAAAAGVARGLDATDTWWLPECSVLRREKRFATLAETMNLVDYWRAYGWPEGCEPKGESFTCR
jgi:TolB-like protein/DNA-binding winged helix-turn-helix (wHTH) protein